MAQIAGRRMTAEIDGDFVVFLIGARPDKFHLVRSIMDLGGRRGMKHMLDYLVAHPEKGLLGYQMGLPTIVQYWRSFDHLEAFASDPHLAVWRNYWKRVGASGRTGTRRTWCGPASTRRSTGTCRRSGWARQAA
jgi:fumigallin biosynthesis monooxygenase-like protein